MSKKKQIELFLGMWISSSLMLSAFSELKGQRESRELWIKRYKELLPYVPIDVLKRMLTDIEFQQIVGENPS